MIHTMPYFLLFSSTMALGTLMALSANQWIFIWIGLELNLMSFIPLMTSQQSSQGTEAAIKYFLAQAMGSGLLLLGGISLMYHPMMILSPSISSLLILFSLLLKLGMAPLHFWFPPVMASLSWPMCLLISTWQKVAPMLLILYLTNTLWTQYTPIIASLGAIVGGIGGINQTQLRPLLAYSSIGHMAWILAISPSSSSLSITYFLIYLIIILSIMLPLTYLSISSSNQTSTLSHQPKWFQILLLMSLLSLGGLPPLTGFIPKLFAINILSSTNQIVLLTFLILGSLMNLSYYLNLFFNIFLKPPSSSLKYKDTLCSNMLMIMAPMISLPLLPILLNLSNLTI
uniref:NADH dehydrogenase subunit 2 n=1 Tax=Synelmis amoureuxi TaxID=3053537 RepID=UPI0030E1A6A2